MKGKMQMMQKMMSDPAGFLDTEMMQGLTLLLAQEEAALQESVADLVNAADVDVDVQVAEPDERAEQLRAGLKAVVSGTVPETWVRHFADAELDHVDEAVEFANADADEWDEQCREWAQRWRENDLEGTDAELSEAHIRTRFGVSRDEFEELVVEWDEERVNSALREMLAGPIEATQAEIDAVTEVLEGGE